MTRVSDATVSRFRRIRITMTVVFAAATALCLLVLAAIAGQIDEDSRRTALDADLQQRVTSLASTVYFDAGTLTLEPLYDDSVARTTQVFAVVQDHAIQLASPDQSALPADAVLTELVRTSTAGAHYLSAPAETGRAFRWTALPVTDGTRAAATVLVGDDMTASDRAHDRLLLGLAGTVLALTLAAAVIGHLLSGRAVRPVITGLKAQEQFLLEAAHELRTPLTTLKLINDSGQRHLEDASAAVTRSAPQIQRLGRLIDGLLLRARIETGSHPLDLSPLRLDQVAELAVEEVGASTGITITSDLTPTVVLGDADLLGQAIRNLLENAIRYADHPAITVRPTLVEVSDSGPGIPEADRIEVTRAGRGSGRGTGTGLAIVSWAVGMNGGRLDLQDAPGGGLLARITFPAPHQRLIDRRAT